jgi:hypothetical protein
MVVPQQQQHLLPVLQLH